MMTQQTASTQAQQLTCAQCRQFKDFHEASGRGWCLQFDQVAKKHHARVETCDLESPTKEAAEAPFKLGEKVKIVDPDEEPIEWAEFIVYNLTYNPHRFKNVETWLSQASWYCHLTSKDGKTQLVVADTELCKSVWAHLVNLSGEF
jgi:hypothetical protein